jgi:hypothetical protein
MTYVQPDLAPAPLEGQALLDLVQGWLAGILSAAVLAPELVRPYAQGTPPLVPDFGTAWMAFTVTVEESDTFPYLGQVSDTRTELQRHERLRVLCSFYDTGVDGQAGRLAALLRDGVAFPQNLETLQLAGVGLVAVEDQVSLPSILKTRWLWRVDQPIILTRQVTREYTNATIATADGTLNTDTGLPAVLINTGA